MSIAQAIEQKISEINKMLQEFSGLSSSEQKVEDNFKQGFIKFGLFINGVLEADFDISNTTESHQKNKLIIKQLICKHLFENKIGDEYNAQIDSIVEQAFKVINKDLILNYNKEYKTLKNTKSFWDTCAIVGFVITAVSLGVLVGLVGKEIINTVTAGLSLVIFKNIDPKIATILGASAITGVASSLYSNKRSKKNQTIISELELKLMQIQNEIIDIFANILVELDSDMNNIGNIVQEAQKIISNLSLDEPVEAKVSNEEIVLSENDMFEKAFSRIELEQLSEEQIKLSFKTKILDLLTFAKIYNQNLIHDVD